MLEIHLGHYLPMSSLRAAHRAAGLYFFSRGAMKFFGSHIEAGPYTGKDGWYFVTSEQDGVFYDSYQESQRRYTVRRINGDAIVYTVSNFMEYADLESARDAAKEAARDSKRQ